MRVNAVETASQGVGVIGATGFAPLVPLATSTLPLDQLGVRLQSHDLVIHDKSLFNPTEWSRRAEIGQAQPARQRRVRARQHYNQAFYRNTSCNDVPLNPATGTSGYVGCQSLVDPAYTSSPASVPRSTATSRPPPATRRRST